MIKVTDDNFMVCADCYPIIANGDSSALDYYYERDEADRREKEINEAINAVQGIICCGDPDNDDEFSTNACDCCGSSLSGTRYHCLVVEEITYVYKEPGHSPDVGNKEGR